MRDEESRDVPSLALGVQSEHDTRETGKPPTLRDVFIAQAESEAIDADDNETRHFITGPKSSRYLTPGDVPLYIPPVNHDERTLAIINHHRTLIDQLHPEDWESCVCARCSQRRFDARLYGR